MTAVCQRETLVGLQGSVGTAVAVDTLLRATCSLKPKVTKIHPEENIGSFAPSRHYVAAIEPEGTLTMDATYEQILIPLWMALGYVAPSDTYVWAFELQRATNPITLMSPFTLEHIDAGPSGTGSYCVRVTDCFATGLTISAAAGEGWKVEAELSGRKVDFPDDISGNPALDTSVTPIKMAETTLQVDSAYGSIGGSTVEELISFNWKLENGYHGKHYAGSLYPNGWGAGRWKTTLELVMEVNAEWLTFADAALATTQFAVRIKGYVDAADYCYIDGVYMVEDISTLDDRDGNNVVKVTLLGEEDTSHNTGVITVQTDVSAL